MRVIACALACLLYLGIAEQLQSAAEPEYVQSKDAAQIRALAMYLFSTTVGLTRSAVDTTRAVSGRFGFTKTAQSRMNADAEEAAKRKWLARQDQDWGRAPQPQANQPLNQMVDDEAFQSLQVEEATKREYLAKLNADVNEPWRGNQAVNKIVEEECRRGDDEACNALNDEEVAKRAWLSRLDQDMNKPWRADRVLNTIVTEECQSGDDEACKAVNAEEEAKRKWLAMRDSSLSQALGANEALNKVVVDECRSGDGEACHALSAGVASKRNVLARLDEEAAFANEVLYKVSANAYMQEPGRARVNEVLFKVAMEACRDGDADACQMLAAEEAAKRIWLKKFGYEQDYSQVKLGWDDKAWLASPHAMRHAPWHRKFMN